MDKYKYGVWALTFLFNAGTLYLTYVTATGPLTDKRRKGILFKLKSKGWIYIVGAILLIIIQLVSIYLTDIIAENDKADLYIQFDSTTNKIQKHADNSVIRIQSSADASKLQIIEALVKYNFKYDSSQGAIVKLIKDSSQRTTRIVESALIPVFSYLMVTESEDDKPVKYLGKINGKDAWDLFYEVRNSPMMSRNMNLSVINMDSTFSKFKYMDTNENFLDSGSIFSNAGLIQRYFYGKIDNAFLFTLFWTRGSYTTVDALKEFQYDDVIFINNSTGRTNTLRGATLKKVKKFISDFKNN